MGRCGETLSPTAFGGGFDTTANPSVRPSLRDIATTTTYQVMPPEFLSAVTWELPPPRPDPAGTVCLVGVDCSARHDEQRSTRRGAPRREVGRHVPASLPFPWRRFVRYLRTHRPAEWECP
jgi:hypothetical protein